MTHTHTRLSDNAMGRPPARHPFTTICAGCDAIGTTMLPQIPFGWQAEKVGGTNYAFCPDCKTPAPQPSGKQARAK